MDTANGVWHNPAYKFTWTEKHLPRAHTDPLRYKYDELGNQALEKLLEIKMRINAEGDSTALKDLYVILKEYHESDPILEKFWDEITFVPDWVDWTQIERAQAFFVSTVIKVNVFDRLNVC